MSDVSIFSLFFDVSFNFHDLLFFPCPSTQDAQQKFSITLSIRLCIVVNISILLVLFILFDSLCKNNEQSVFIRLLLYDGSVPFSLTSNLHFTGWTEWVQLSVSQQSCVFFTTLMFIESWLDYTWKDYARNHDHLFVVNIHHVIYFKAGHNIYGFQVKSSSWPLFTVL